MRTSRLLNYTTHLKKDLTELEQRRTVRLAKAMEEFLVCDQLTGQAPQLGKAILDEGEQEEIYTMR